jgi:hypothetical protein
MRHHELPVGEETLEFWGRFVDDVDTDSGDRARWAELRLYKIIDTNPDHDDSWPHDDGFRGTFGEEIWLLYTVGHSVVYHDLFGCNKGVAMKIADFEEGGMYVNNEKLVPPEKGFLPVAVAEQGLTLEQYVAMGISEKPCPGES